MDADIQKAIDAGKLSAQAGAALAALKPGSYCLHKSWGFGRIESINFLINQVTIDFKTKKGHTMQLQYAAESLQPIPDNHILAQKATNLEGIRAMAQNAPLDLVRLVLGNYGGRATQDQFALALIGDLFNEAEFKRWWDSTKKALKKDGRFTVPTKRTDPIEMRDEAISRADELLAAFNSARQLKDQLAAIDQILKNLEAFNAPATQLKPAVETLELSAQRNQKLHTSKAFELILARDEICDRVKDVTPGANAPTLVTLIRDEERRLVDILSAIPAAKLKRIVSLLPEAFGDGSAANILNLMLRSSIRLVSELARVLEDRGSQEELRTKLDQWIREHSITTEILYWLCKERDGTFADLMSPQVFSAILSALERDQFNEVKRGGKLHDLLLEDRELIPDLLAGADHEAVRDSMRRLLLTPVFEELNKRSILGRIIRIYPEMQSMLTGGETTEKQEALIVSWESLEKRKAEYEDLINKKIPENTKEISIARSYGDLRENFEFKAAKEMQRVLMRRKAEMEQALSRARGTGFENPDTTQVSIGTVVTIREVSSGQETRYSILGAWDSAPEQHIISYLTAIGQALLGHRVGERVDLPTEHGAAQTVEIIAIEAYNAAVAGAAR